MSTKQNVFLALSDLSAKEQRLQRALTLLRSHPTLDRHGIATLIAKELNVDRTTAYAYLRELRQSLGSHVARALGQ